MNKLILFVEMLLSKVIELIFGVRAEGIKLPKPTFRSTYPENHLNESEWAKEVKFGSRYGHRGSFYQSR